MKYMINENAHGKGKTEWKLTYFFLSIDDLSKL